MTAPVPATLSLWPTTLAVTQWAEAAEVNPLLVRVLGAMRATALAADPAAASRGFHASHDDLLQRIQLPEWHRLVRFIVESVRDTAAAANRHAWPDENGQAPALNIGIEGIWFQFSNQGAHHDVHTHGNCSWSGVYCIDVDSEAERTEHPVFGALNGITRFYGPHFNRLGGGYMDFGNAYLQQPHTDVSPRPGQLVVFPSWLPHQAMPYSGRTDRLIVSFNASVHRAQGGNRLHGYERG
jgi:hypothetical protein